MAARTRHLRGLATGALVVAVGLVPASAGALSGPPGPPTTGAGPATSSTSTPTSPISAGSAATTAPPASSSSSSTTTTPPNPAGAGPGAPAPRGPLDCTHWRYGPADQPAPGSLPTEYDPANPDWKLTSARDPRLAASPHNLCGQEGAAVDLAWGVTQGAPSTRIAILDSGIEWSNVAAMRDLADKTYLNAGELPVPCTGDRCELQSSRNAADYDVNHDGVFNVEDYAHDPRVHDANGNGVLDPEDVIDAFSCYDARHHSLGVASRPDGHLVCSNGAQDVDNDGNGYPHDVAGWDFLYDTNDPVDTVSYGHGTGEAEDSSAQANNGGDVGTCPRCLFMPVRVGDSFIADGARFASGVLFALDSGASVIQEALGALSNPPQAQQAVDAAYSLGVPVVASMADEASEHPNLPSSLDHTIPVNSVTRTQSPPNYLALNGCTNHGGTTFVSVPSSSCSSEATGKSAGMVGLLEAEARAAGVPPYPGLRSPGGNVLSANEAMQIVRMTADDVDFSTPNAVDPANDFSLGTPGVVRYPTTPGWDATDGYGRINAYEMVKAVRDHRIPPEADLTGPSGFDVLPAHGVVSVTGRVAAVRARSYSYRVEWAPGLQPPLYPDQDHWTVVGGDDGLHGPRQGVLARLDLASVAASLPGGGSGAPSDPATGRADPDRFAMRIRVVVTASGGSSDGLTGTSREQVFVHDDPDLVPGFPARVAGAGTSSPVFADLAAAPAPPARPPHGRDHEDRRSNPPSGASGARRVLLLATDDGTIHALDSRGRELPGWPVHSLPAFFWHPGSTTARAFRIRAPGSAFMVGAPVVADLNGDGSVDVAAADLAGNVYAWDARGRLLPGFRPTEVEGQLRSSVHTDPAFSRNTSATQDPYNRTLPGFAGSLAAADLEGTGRLDLVGASLDRHVYAWRPDGTPVPGFPVLVVDPAKVQAVDPVSHHVTFAPGSGVDLGGELTATPAIGDLDGDGRPDIVVGAQEEYDEPFNAAELPGGIAGQSGNTRLYAISSKGTLAREPGASPVQPGSGAYLPGWPVKLGMLETSILPDIGDGVAVQAAIGSVVPGAPGPQVAAAAAAGPVYVFEPSGASALGSVTVGGARFDHPLLWFGTGFGAGRTSNDLGIVAATFAGPSIGALVPGSGPDVATSTAGLQRVLAQSEPNLHLGADDQLMAWDPAANAALPGFPHQTADLAFFVTPAIGNVSSDGVEEVVAGNGVFTLDAVRADGSEPTGWPKLTGGWLLGTPTLGDWFGDGGKEVAVVRRDGVVLVWRAHPGTTAPDPWPRFGHDGTNSGSAQGAG